MASTLVQELETVENDAGKLIKGDVLDMWRLYKSASANPELFFELTFYDLLEARNGLLFPDFFKAVHTLVNDHDTNKKMLETDLEATFSTMHLNWNRYEPFFNRHPELRYLNRHEMFSFALRELAGKLPPVRSMDVTRLWSLKECHKLRGDLDDYVRLDEKLARNSIGTIFEKDSDYSPGTCFIYVRPSQDEISPYLPLLKHGDFIGFGSLALAERNGQKFIAVTSLQTDLLRTDSVAGKRDDLGLPATFYPKVVKNSKGAYTVPHHLALPYLENYFWAQSMLQAIESTALAMPGVSGVIIPTASVGFTDYMLTKIPDNVEGMGLANPLAHIKGYAKGLYDEMPQKRGYNLENSAFSFPLTNQLGIGSFWTAASDALAQMKT